MSLSTESTMRSGPCTGSAEGGVGGRDPFRSLGSSLTELIVRRLIEVALSCSACISASVWTRSASILSSSA